MNYWLLLLIPGFAFINHFRGGGVLFGLAPLTTRLPGRSLFYATPMAGLVMWPYIGSYWAAYFAFAYFFWGVWAWAHDFDLHHMPDDFPDRPRTAFEQFTFVLGGRNEYWSFSIRNTLVLIPMIAFSPWLPVLGAIQTGCYAIGWALRPAAKGGGVPYGEILTGAVCWGSAAIVAASVEPFAAPYFAYAWAFIEPYLVDAWSLLIYGIIR